jgi:hypothetical protein
MTIDKQQSGRDQATGPPERETLQERTVPLWPSETTSNNNYQSGSADAATTRTWKRVDSVIVTIGNHEVDSANVAVRINNRKSGR